MNNLPIASSGNGLARVDQRQDRRLAKLKADAQLAREQIRETGDIERVRAHAITSVGKGGMVDVAVMSQLEVTLTGFIPTSIARVQGIADITALSVAEVVTEAGRRIQW